MYMTTESLFFTTKELPHASNCGVSNSDPSQTPSAYDIKIFTVSLYFIILEALIAMAATTNIIMPLAIIHKKVLFILLLDIIHLHYNPAYHI